ncbi:MAG: RluA family pseudouridine synthase [Thermogutta sp.]
MTSRAIEILHECEACLAVNKPAGILTQGPPHVPALDKEIRAYLAANRRDVRTVYLGVPHRLDRPVTGVIVFTRHARATRRMTEQFQGRMIRKIYWACVEGRLKPAYGVLRDFVRKVPDEPRAEIVPPDHPEARPAILNYRVIGRTAWGDALEIELETGRMHQIRIQLGSRGYPIVGDVAYGGTTCLEGEIADPRLRPIALHARSLSYLQPMTFEPIQVTAPLPEAWSRAGLAAAFAGLS